MVAGYEGPARLFKVLMHPARLEILDILRDGEACVCHIEATLGQRQAYISQQLSVLRGAGIVQVRREGWNIHYHVAQPQVFALLDVALAMTGGQRETRRGAKTSHCPCPRCAEAEPVIA